MESLVSNPSTEISEDPSVNGVVTMPKTQTDMSLCIQGDGEVTIERSLTAKCVYVAESAKLIVKGSLESGIYLEQGASVLIEGDAKINTLYVNDSKVCIEGNLVLETTDKARISNHSCLLVKGSMSASIGSLSIDESSLIVHDDLQINGRVHLLKKSRLETKGDAIMRLGLSVRDTCSTNIGKCLNVSRRVLTIGSNGEVISHTLDSIKESVKIQAMSFIAEFLASLLIQEVVC